MKKMSGDVWGIHWREWSFWCKVADVFLETQLMEHTEHRGGF